MHSPAAHAPPGPAPVVVKEMEWNHKIMIIGQKVQDPLLHLCEKCSLPILVYGRLSPCKHSFCLSCAEKGAGKCPRCGENVQRIERAPLGSVFVCSIGGSRYGISGCRRSYFSQRDLQSHIKRRHQRDQGGDDSDGNEGETEVNRAMFPHVGAGVPFFLPPPPRNGVPVMPHPLGPGDRPYGSVPMAAASMDARHFVPTMPREPFFMEAQRPQHPPVGGFPGQAPPHMPTHVPQAGFPHPDQPQRLQEVRGDARQSRAMPGPSVIDEPFGQARGPAGPTFRFTGPEPEVRQGGNWPPRSEADWMPDRGPAMRAERDWIIPAGRSDRGEWVPARPEGNWPPHGRGPLPGDSHYRPMF
ncbi:E3 ubiquitin-protein ligase Hakai isoform X2 [Nematostella vectensis]|nr:E3 ubiquitin-protein ligase Hakai isoform X2 [Nematostella vectensis]